MHNLQFVDNNALLCICSLLFAMMWQGMPLVAEITIQGNMPVILSYKYLLTCDNCSVMQELERLLSPVSW